MSAMVSPGLRRDVQGDGEVADFVRFPDQRVACPALRGDANFFGRPRRRSRCAARPSPSVARQRAFDRERNADRFADDAERGRVEAQQFDVRQALRTADRHRKHGHAGHAEPDRRPRRAGRPRSSRRPRAARRRLSRANFSGASVSGAAKSVPLPATGCENGCTTTLNRSRQAVATFRLCVTAAIASWRVVGRTGGRVRRRPRRAWSCWPKRRRARRSRASRRNGTFRPIPVDSAARRRSPGSAAAVLPGRRSTAR